MELLTWMDLIPNIILGSAVAVSTFYYANKSKQRDEDLLMKDLFKEFNARYDALNNKLYQIVEPNPHEQIDKMMKLQDINPEAVIIDYFNLCAEEYFWYKKNRVHPKVWESWKAGMNYWYHHENDIIRKTWEKEIKKRNGRISYYLEENESFFEEKLK